MLTTKSRIEAVRAEWDALAISVPSPMAQCEWTLAAVDTIEAERDLHLVTLRDHGDLIAVAPLMRQRQGLVSVLRPIAERSFEPPAFAFRDAAALAALLDAIGRLGYPLVIRRAYADGAEAAAFPDHPPGGVRPAGRARLATANKRLSGEAFEAGLVRQRRSAEKRKKAAAKKLGPVEISFFSPDAAAAEAALSELIAVEATGWKGRAGSALSHDPELQAFYRAYAQFAAARGTLRFGRITIGGSIAAIGMGIEWAAERWDLKIAFDEAFADILAGPLLTYETLEDGLSRGAKVHNFLGGHESWQDEWGIELRQLVTLRHYPRSARGLLALGWEGIGFGLDKIKRKLPRG